MEASEFVATLASGAALGALVSGLVQFVLASRHRRWDREDGRRERRRALYEGYLHHAMTLPTRIVRHVVENGPTSKFAEENRLAFDKLRVAILLDASPEVRDGLREVHEAIRDWLTELAQTKHEEGSSIGENLDREWEARVMPSVKKVTAAMAAELYGG